MPEIKTMLPPKLPEPFEGRLFQSEGRMIGEYEDVMAFPYRSYEDYKNYLHVITNGEGKSFLLPDSTGMNITSVSAVMTAKDEIWIAFGLPITVNQYHIGSDSVTLVSSTILGDSKSRLKDLIKLDNGKLFVAWHQFERGRVDAEGNPGIDVGFAYRTLDGNWHTLPYTWVFPFGIPATHGAVCQHPDDGSIWFFCQPDSRGLVCVIHLVESGEEISVDWTDYDFLNHYDGAMAPEGELPFFSAVADKQRNAIILAYQSDDWQMFSVDPFCKGAKPAVIQINSDATKSLLFVLDKRLERSNPLYVGLNDQNEVWLAYGRIDEANFTWNDLYVSTENRDRYCGKMQYGIPGNAGVRLCNSSKLVIATMDDGHIHFFNREAGLMIAKFNPTGTHIHKGFLKVRIDLYPDITSKTYIMQHVQVPVIPPKGYPGKTDKLGRPLDWEHFDGWIKSLPKVWRVNPCLCHFITIDANTSLDFLVSFVKGVFSEETLNQLDDSLSKLDTPQVAKIMKTKCGIGKVLPPAINIPQLLEAVNSRFVELEIEV